MEAAGMGKIAALVYAMNRAEYHFFRDRPGVKGLYHPKDVLVSLKTRNDQG